LVVARWRAALAAAAVAAFASLPHWPLFIPTAPALEGRTQAGPTLTVMQANIMLGTADAAAITALARERSVDVLVVEELSEAAVERFDAAGIADALPHRFLAPGSNVSPDAANGTGVYSRYPLADPEVLDGFQMRNVTALLLAGGRAVRLVGMHTVAPVWHSPREWFAELHLARDALGRFADAGDPVVVAGDFNATWNNAEYRKMLRGGYADAADAVGAGLSTTWPSQSEYGRLIGIDHIAARFAAFRSLATVPLPGSDHWGLIAEVTPYYFRSAPGGGGDPATGPAPAAVRAGRLGAAAGPARTRPYRGDRVRAATLDRPAVPVP
jgi:endonuclease/exonuclease/phosphatase (EEP) superfamily protein YafD